MHIAAHLFDHVFKLKMQNDIKSTVATGRKFIKAEMSLYFKVFGQNFEEAQWWKNEK